MQLKGHQLLLISREEGIGVGGAGEGGFDPPHQPH